MFSLVPFVVALAASVVAQRTTIEPAQCSCGYYDEVSQQLYTESIVIYFNETETLPSDFVAQTFEHKKEKGWTSIYRQGAIPENVNIGNSSQPSWRESNTNPSSLELFCDPGNDKHLVEGGSLASIRQDIQYGSFRASMRSPHPFAGGSVLSMMLPFNESDSIELDLMNTDEASTGRVATLLNGEYPDSSLGVNYSLISSGTPGIPAASPWDYMTLRFDWTADFVNFTVNDNLTRSISKDQSSGSIPKVAMPLIFKHWSVGDMDFMQGPPSARSGANVAWVRAFFNSSNMSPQQHQNFDARCQPSLACGTDDSRLRGSTAFETIDTLAWTPPPVDQKLVYRSAIVAGIFGVFGAFVLMHAILTRWVPWHWLSYRYWAGKSKARHGRVEMLEKERSAAASRSTLVGSGASSQRSVDYGMKKSHGYSMSQVSTAVNSRAGSASNSRAPSPTRKHSDDSKMHDLYDAKDDSFSNSAHPATPSSPTPSKKPRSATLSAVIEDADKPTFASMDWAKMSSANSSRDDILHAPGTGRIKIAEVASRTNSELSLDKGKGVAKEEHQFHLPHLNMHAPHLQSHEEGHVTTTSNFHSRSEKLDEKGLRRDPVRMTSMIPPQGPQEPKQVAAPQNVRIDYLAGAVAFSCICVTFVHFCLTFLPGVTGWGPVDHDRSDYWAFKTIAPYLLTEVWIGPFFTTSSRFLSARYFRDGKLSDIGNKTLLRAPRLLVPVAMIAMAQYFLLEMGLTGALEYLPSITWSTWPYVTSYPNFGSFINAMFDIAYLIPNAAPAIVPYYCIGVLWTIPVQLQYSYTVLLGAVMVKEIKTPWKRFAFYTFVVVNYWYALNWGSLFWLGLMLSDLAVTYKYKEWVHARPWAHYSIISLMCVLVALSTTAFLVANDFSYNFLTVERNIHPDPNTGLLIGETANAGYPNYFEPRLNTLVLASSLQVIVELSTWVQKFLSLKAWQWVFPHIMTIYLLHGLIFWTFGAWLCLTLSVHNVPYWANMLVTVVLSYTLLAIVCYIVTPLTDKTAKNACKNLWRWAQEEPVPKRPTLGSYPKNLILNRATLASAEEPAA